MDWLVLILLRRLIRRGSLTVTTAAGKSYTLGDGSGPPVAVRFTTAKAQRAVLLDPEFKLGEAYMDGTFVVEQGSIAELLAILLQQEPVASNWARPPRLARYLVRRLQQFNLRSRARQNVAHHYDLDGRLYSLFLDGDQQYSCAYFESPDQSLDDAQLAKKRHLAAKLLVERGATVLDIGCGWGGLALYLAELDRRASYRHHAVARTVQTRAEPRAGARPRRGGDFSPGGLSRCRGPLRSHRIGRHVRARRRRLLRHVLPQMREPARRRGVSCSCIRSAARVRQASPIRGSPNTSFRAAISRLYRKCCRASSGPASSLPTSKSCSSIMPKR